MTIAAICGGILVMLLACWLLTRRQGVDPKLFRLAVLQELDDGPRFGRDLRQRVGYKGSILSFYCLMANLEDEGLIIGTNEPQPRWYRLP